MTQYAKGPFDVKVTPQKPDNPQAEGAGVGRMSIDKQLHGDLEATSQGEMLSYMTEAKSGAYVAIEKVSGTLGGRKGSFVLHHTGTMTRGTPSRWSVTIVPDSGTEELAGLTGSMTISIAPDGKHSYELEYDVAPTG